MDESDSAAANGNGNPETTSTVGERWRLPALDILQRWTPRRRWLQFAAAIEERHVAAFVRSTPKRRDLGRGLAAGSPDLEDAPAGLASTYPSPMAVAHTVAETDWMADRLDQADRGTQRRGWEVGASLRASALEARAAVRPPVTATSQRGEADGRPEDGRIEERLVAGALRGLARTLDPHVQGYLSGLLDLRIPAVQIHTGQAADAAARKLNADAVSFGQSIMFRAGKFAPDSASGLGLIGHELTHVAHAESGGLGGSLDRAALAREELAAVENEKRVLRHVTGKPVITANIAAVPQAPTPRALRSTPAPRAAAVDRGVAPAPIEGGVMSPAPELTAQQLAALKDAIYRDLMDRIRTDFERGA